MGGSLTEEELTQLLTKYPQLKQIKICMESGTYKGESTRLLSKFFDRVYTFEINKLLYDEAKKISEEQKIDTEFYLFGDSVKLLRRSIISDQRPCFLFLDAHISGADSSWNKEELVPLLSELKVINNFYPNNHIGLICVDDVRLFDKFDDWKNITIDSIKETLNNHKITKDFIQDDRYWLIIND